MLRGEMASGLATASRLAMTILRARPSSARSTTAPRFQLTQVASAEAERRSAEPNCERRDMQHGDAERQSRSGPSRRWRSRPRSPARRCADAGSASCWRTPPGNSASMPLMLGPTQPDSVTTVPPGSRPASARSGMSYQRRVISGILTCRKRASSGMQIANGDRIDEQVRSASDQCTVQRSRRDARSRPPAAVAQLTSALWRCASST